MTRERILIVEDDARIGSTLRRGLTGAGYTARWETTGSAGLGSFKASRPNLVLLDLGLPDADGLIICRRMYELDPSVAIVMLTARDEELDVVVGLDAGASDYVTKPFKLAELLARIRAQLRQSKRRSRARQDFGDLVVDGKARRVWLEDEEIALRPKEFDLLSRLVADVGTVVSRETLMRDVWDENWFGSTKTLDFHIAALRRKVDKSGETSRITTVRGVGYRFELK
jgi:DNA-binding response OmpR family regulator